jgi:hypothetical protein
MVDLLLDPTLDIWLDGEVGRSRHLTVSIEPDALRVVV